MVSLWNFSNRLLLSVIRYLYWTCYFCLDALLNVFWRPWRRSHLKKKKWGKGKTGSDQQLLPFALCCVSFKGGPSDLGRKFYKNAKKSSLYYQSLFIFIHETPVVENHPTKWDIRDYYSPGRHRRESLSILTWTARSFTYRYTQKKVSNSVWWRHYGK